MLATAGNAVLGVANGAGAVTTPIATAVPLAQPITGTITRMLNDTGTALVDVGQGRTLLVNGVKGVVGDALTIAVGNNPVLTAANGAPGAIGVAALGTAAPAGTLATAGVLNAGNVVSATVNGVANVSVANVTAPTGGASANLVNLALNNTNVIGNGQPALVNANLLPGGVPTTGGITNVASTVTGAVGGVPVAGPVAAGVVGAVANTVGTAGNVVSQVVNTATSATGAAAPVLSTVTAATGGAGATGATGGLLAPVGTIVNGVVSALPAVSAGASASGATNGQTGLVSGLLGGKIGH